LHKTNLWLSEIEQKKLNILTYDGVRIAINPNRFDKLITALRAVVDKDVTLDKESISYNDIFDAFRLALKLYHFEDRRSM
jgi:hypothetical protein